MSRAETIYQQNINNYSDNRLIVLVMQHLNVAVLWFLECWR